MDQKRNGPLKAGRCAAEISSNGTYLKILNSRIRFPLCPPCSPCL